MANLQTAPWSTGEPGGHGEGGEWVRGALGVVVFLLTVLVAYLRLHS